MIPPAHRYRILYVGNNLALLKFLEDGLKHLDCFIVRASMASPSKTFIESDINYPLLLFDDELLDAGGPQLKHFARQLSHRKRTPIIIFKESDEFNSLAQTIIQALATHDQAS
jgi:hypothetical protein